MADNAESSHEGKTIVLVTGANRYAAPIAYHLTNPRFTSN
jgi:hypothetical protein